MGSSREYRQKYYQEHKAQERASRKRYMRDNPWLSHYYDAKRRCTKKNRKDYARYGGKGITFHLTVEDVKILWFRDKAFNMKTPSIDRLCSHLNYTFMNCRFIEHSKNSFLGRRKQVIQKTLEGKRIWCWDSIKQITLALGYDTSNLSEAIRDKRPAHGYYWEVA